MSKRTRREFLEHSMMATAAALAAGSATSAFAQDPAEQPSGRTLANDILGVAVLGVNGRGGSHIQNFSAGGGGGRGRRGGRGGAVSNNTQITYICDPDESVGRNNAQRVSTSQGSEVKYVKDMREAFEDPNVDVVSIATPNYWHSLAAIWAMQAGKDVYVEKPISHNVAEGRRVVEAAIKLNKICQVGTQCRSNPGTADAIAFIQGGGIGEVSVSRGFCYKPRPSIGAAGTYEVASSVDYNLYCGPASDGPLTRPQLHYDWHWQREYGNGDLGNQGIHQMDVARWALGVNQLPDAVISYGGRLGYEDAGDTANTQVVIMPYGNKSVVFEVRGLRTGSHPRTNQGVANVVEGSEGYVSFPNYTTGIVFDLDGNEVRRFTGGGDNLHFSNFIQAVRSRDRSSLNAESLDGHLSSAMCHLGNISYYLGEELAPGAMLEKLADVKVSDNVQETFDRTRQHLTENGVDLEATKLRLGPWLAIDPATEKFTNNDQANTMLSREYRAPFVVPSSVEQI
jgi:predicted dehydrogenase